MFLPLLLVATALQTEMTPQEKKKTGLYKLSQRERSSLQKWIEANYSSKSTITADKPAQKSLLEENFHDGKFIRLKDGSTWEIRPQDTAVTASWITPVDVSFALNDDALYPYTLTNTLTQSTVHAKKVDSVPVAPPGHSIVPPSPPPQPTRSK